MRATRKPAVEHLPPPRLPDEELASVAGAASTVLSNLANMRHEMLKAVAQNLRA